LGEPIIREARADELDRVRAAYAEWGYGAGANPEDTILLAESDGELLGIVRRTDESGTLMLRGMQVAPEARGQGVGTRLLESFVRGLDGRECYCIPYAHLVAFYRRAGFEVQAPEGAPAFLAERLSGYRAAGLDVILMRRLPTTPAPWLETIE
jgi:GNAT superfamily N-acetyltransferase